MSNKKKPVGMALDISTGKSYKVYQPEPETITLTLTREQAERFIADVDCLMPMGFYGAHPEIGKLKKQIEEKLK